MVMCPFGSSLLVGMASGGIRRLQIGSADPATRRPKLVDVSGECGRCVARRVHAHTPC
jgi:hypothetical protein